MAEDFDSSESGPLIPAFPPENAARRNHRSSGNTDFLLSGVMQIFTGWPGRISPGSHGAVRGLSLPPTATTMWCFHCPHGDNQHCPDDSGSHAPQGVPHLGERPAPFLSPIPLPSLHFLAALSLNQQYPTTVLHAAFYCPHCMEAKFSVTLWKHSVMASLMCEHDQAIVFRYLIKCYSGSFCEHGFWMRLTFTSLDFGGPHTIR